jgi:hypothetical protein
MVFRSWSLVVSYTKELINLIKFSRYQYSDNLAISFINSVQGMYLECEKGALSIFFAGKSTGLDLDKRKILQYILIFTYYKTKSSPASVCLSACLLAMNSKNTARIFMRFSPVDRVIIPENSSI